MKIKNSKLFFVNKLPVNSDFVICKGLSLLTGENGVGKSSFFNFVKANRSHFIKNQKIAFMDQFPLSPINDVRVCDAIDLLSRGLTHFYYEDALLLLKDFQLEYLVDRPIRQLSGGENQLLKFILLVSQNVDYYFLDEPLQYIDRSRLDVLKKKIQNLSYEKSIFLIEHRIELLEDLNPKRVLMENCASEVRLYGV